MICRGARAQVFKTMVNNILRHAPSHLLHDHQLSISSMLSTLVAVPKRKGKGYDSIGSFCLIILSSFLAVWDWAYLLPPFSHVMTSE